MFQCLTPNGSSCSAVVYKISRNSLCTLIKFKSGTMSYLSIIKSAPLVLDCANILLKQMSTKVRNSHPRSSDMRLSNIKWRQANGYPDNLTSRGILTDGPDYSFADGKPTPYTTGQRARILRQREYAEKVQRLLFITEKSKKAFQENVVAAKQMEKEKILSRKLKAKGRNMLQSR